MTQIGAENLFAQFIRISQVAIVSNKNPVGRVHIERLCQRWARAASGWVANMADTHIADKTHHMTATEYIPRQALAFALVKFTIGLSNNTSGVLTAMLQHGQGIVKP